MAELEDQLNRILSSPETLQQLLSIAEALGGGGLGGEETPTDRETSSPPPAEPEPDLFGNLLKGLDFGMLAKLTELMGSLNHPGEKEQLLQAMRPFLRQERAERLDRAIQGARISRVLRQAMELLGKEG